MLPETWDLAGERFTARRAVATDVADDARARGCVLVQLTSAVERTDAHRFYEREGFAASHVGFKLAPR